MIWTRREFVRASALGLAAAAVRGGPLAARGRIDEFRELRRGVGIYTNRGGTIGWLVNADGAVVVDSQYPDTAEACVRGLAERSSLPLDALINTHHHGDHTAGNPIFREAARSIVAHERVPELQREAARDQGTEEDQAYPDTTFGESWSLEVGGETVRARHYGRAHTGGDATIFFQEANVAHMGDLVFNRVYPFIDRPGGASVRGWVSLLERVAAEHDGDTLYVFGHGRPGFGVTGSREDVLVQRDFLGALLETAEGAIREGRSRAEATNLDRLPAFPDHVAIVERLSLGAALGVAYDELREEG